MLNIGIWSMEEKMRKLFIGMLGLSLTACLEPQPAPNISKRRFEKCLVGRAR